MQSRRPALFFFAAVAIVALLTVLPATGWLVRREMRHAAGVDTPQPLVPWGPHDPHIQTVADAHPDNYQFQLARAIANGSVEEAGKWEAPRTAVVQGGRARALLPLRERFGNRPELLAHILAYLTVRDLRINRGDDIANLPFPEASQASPQAPSQGPSSSEENKSLSPQLIALVTDIAERGEALDPGNGYFPLMDSLALLAARQDSEAFAALRRAAAKPDWNAYWNDEAYARWALIRATYGETGVISRMTSSSRVQGIGQGKFNTYADVLISLACQKEIAGNRQSGYEVRSALAHVSARMRAHSRASTTIFTSRYILETSMKRPGGTALPDSSQLTSEVYRARLLQEYVSYLKRIGHPEEASWIIAEADAEDKAHFISHQTFSLDNKEISPENLLDAGWTAGVSLLISTCWTLLAGGFAALTSRTKFSRVAKPMPRGVRWGIALSAIYLVELTVLLVISALLDTDTSNTGIAPRIATRILVGTGLFLPLLLALISLKRGESWRGFGRGLGFCTLSFAGFAGLVALAIVSTKRLALLTPLYLFGLAQNVTSEDQISVSRFIINLELAELALFVPISILVFHAIRHRRQNPVWTRAVLGLRNSSLAASGIQLCLFAAVIGFTLKLEAHCDSTLQAAFKNEGQYYASEIGQTWPDEVPMAVITPPSGKIQLPVPHQEK